MSLKEELIEKVIKIKESEKREKKDLKKEEIEQESKRFLGKLKRKYRLMLIFLVCLTLIFLCMIFPVILIMFLQNP